MTVNPQTKVYLKPSHAWLAMRVACNVCGGHHLDHVQQNLLECSNCHTKQWSVLNLRNEYDFAPRANTPGLLQQLLILLGFPQPAIVKYIPKATQFFWFKCTKCSKTSIDYKHGYSQYFTCEFCKSTIRTL